MGPFGLDRGGWIGSFAEVVEVVAVVAEEVVATKTGVALTALRVQDPEGRPSPRRPVAIAGNERLRPLPDDVAPEPDPRPPDELQPDPGRLGDSGSQTTSRTTDQPGWLEDDEKRLRPPGERRQPAEPVSDPGRTVRRGEATPGQIQDEQVHRAPGQQGTADGQTLVQSLRGDDNEPLEPNAAGDGLDRVEAAREVQPGHDGALSLGLRRDP